MLVNISMTVRGQIPGLGLLAPQVGIEVTEQWIRSVLNISYVRVYEASSKRLITSKNVDEFDLSSSGGQTPTPPGPDDPDPPKPDEPDDPSAGGTGDLSFVYEQSTASANWTIEHKLGKNPSVTVIDSSNDELIGDISYPDKNTVVITFSEPVSGKAFLN